MRKLCAAMAAGVSLAFSAAATAAPVTFSISGAFDAPATGSFSGSLTFDDVTGVVPSATINTTAGKGFDGTTDLPAATMNWTNTVFTTVVVAESVPANGLRGGWLIFSTVLPGALPPVIRFEDRLCLNADCTSGSFTPSTARTSSAVTLVHVPPPVTVPTMTEWAMILFGLLLAGGAALHIGRRRPQF